MESLCVIGAGIAVSLVMAWGWHHLLMPRHMQLGRTGRFLMWLFFFLPGGVMAAAQSC